MPIKELVNDQGLIDWLRMNVGEKVENYLEWENGNIRWKDLISLWHVQHKAKRIRHASKEVITSIMDLLPKPNLFNQAQEKKQI